MTLFTAEILNKSLALFLSKVIDKTFCECNMKVNKSCNASFQNNKLITVWPKNTHTYDIAKINDFINFANRVTNLK